MDAHIYVLGSNSFSGAHFIHCALEKGYTVTGVSRSPQANPLFLPYLRPDGSAPPAFTFLQADLNHDLDRLTACVEKDRPSFIVNFAAQGMVAESWQHPEQWLLTNTVSPVMFYERLRRYPWLVKFVQISTPEVYGSSTGLIKEHTHYLPSTPYAVFKAAADMNLSCYHKYHNFPVVFTRAANVFGPCQQLYRIIPRTILRFLTGDTIDLHGGGESVRSFIHISDVADATLRIMRDGPPGEIFHISTQRSISIRDLVFLIANIMGVDAQKSVRIVGERLGKDAAYLLDTAKLRQMLNWQDNYELEAGIRGVVAWTTQHLDTLVRLPQNYEHKA